MGDMAEWDEAVFDDRFVRDRLERQSHEFALMLIQEEYWLSWDSELHQFTKQSIADMDRLHAKNAMKWLRHNQRRAYRSLLISRQGREFLGEDVTTLPVYDALRERTKVPPVQRFTRKELKIIASVLGDDVPADIRAVCTRIARKALTFLDIDA